MENMIRYSELFKYAYSNEKLLTGEIRAIVLHFYGELDSCEIVEESPAEAVFLAKQNILYIMPYTNPWSWMNRQAIAYTNEVMNVICTYYSLSSTIPIAVTGTFMGGQAALRYMAYGERTPVICSVVSPPCDLETLYKERPEVQRTLYNSVFMEDGTLDEALKAASPLFFVDKLPKAFYRIDLFSDESVITCESSVECFVQKMEEIGKPVALNKEIGNQDTFEEKIRKERVKEIANYLIR